MTFHNSSFADETIGYMPMPSSFPYKSVFLRGRPKHEKYDDFWRRHPPMDPVHRAKIFAPFAALEGFEECIDSKNVLYTDRKDLSEGEREELDRRLAILRHLTRNAPAARENRPEASITFFSPCTDKYSSAYGRQGRYETVTGIVSKVDTLLTRTITIDHKVIDISEISEINGEIFESEDPFFTG